MRSIRMFLLGALVLVLFVPLTPADHLQPNCPLSLIGQSAPASPFGLSPHGVFRNGSLVYALRGQTLTTFDVTELGDLRVARQDFISSMGAHDRDGAAAYSGGFLFVSGETGLEIFDLRNVRAGGSAPLLVSRTPGLHYRRIVVDGNILAALYPATDLPCQPRGNITTPNCRNSVDLFNISNLANPTLAGRIVGFENSIFGFNDIAFANGFLYTTGFSGTHAWSVSNPALPVLLFARGTIGKFLATNGSSVLAIGQDKLIGVFSIGPGFALRDFAVFTVPAIFNRSNEVIFHPRAHVDDSRLITMLDELDPATGRSARTIAFDVFDFSVPFSEGALPRFNENITYTYPDEVKYDPIAVGPYVHVVGEISGLQKWGVCDLMAGELKFDFVQSLPCGGAELTGFVTAKTKISFVEVFLDDRSLGFATLGPEPIGVTSGSPVRTFRLGVNFDNEARGARTLRAIGTDILGNRRQFYSTQVFFPGPGENCTLRKRSTRR